VSLPIWRKNVELQILEFKADEKRRKYYVLTGVGYMALLQSPKDSYQLKKFPFRTYKIQNWHLNLENEEMLAFWATVGPLIRHFFLVQCTFERVEDFRKIVFKLTPNLESLELNQNKFKCDRAREKTIRLDPSRKEHLKPKNVQKNLKKFDALLQRGEVNDDADADDDEASWYALPTTWIEFFAHFPNIDKIYLEQLANEDGDLVEELVEFFKSMEIVRNNLGFEYFAELKQLNIAFGA